MIDIKAYIQNAKQMGMSDEAIRSSLLSMGIDGAEVNNLMPPTAVSEPMAQNGNFNASVSVSGGVASTISGPSVQNEQDIYIRKWSWGAFLLGWLYFAASRMGKRAVGYFSAMFLGPVFLVFAIMAGLNGRKKVWESGKWADFESYKKRQKVLDIIGISLLAIGILVPLAMFVFSPKKVAEQTTQQEKTAEVVAPATEGIATTSVAVSSRDCGSVSGDALFSKVLGQSQTHTPVSPQDCGSAGGNNPCLMVIGQPYTPLSENEKNVIDCMDQSFLNCSPAKFAVTNKTGQISYNEILGMVSGECQFYRGNYSNERVTCRILPEPFEEIKTTYSHNLKETVGEPSVIFLMNADIEATTGGEGDKIISCEKFANTQ